MTSSAISTATVRYMIDTNTVSYIVKGTSAAARARLTRLTKSDTACISAITVAEIRFGLAKRPPSPAFLIAIESFLSRIPILPWDERAADVYGVLRAKQEALGKTLESMDMLIAAHAVAAETILVTHDRVFRQVKDLGSTVDWATDLPR